MSASSSDLAPNINPRSLLILYATETGTSQDVADQIARQCRRIYYHCRVVNMSVYPLDDLLEEETVIFVVSTTGSGTEPRSMKNLWDGLLNPLLPPDLFSEGPLLNFTVFALGDSSYEKFCWPGKMLARRLENLGAHEFCERGEGDEQHQLGIDGALQPWMETLVGRLLEMKTLPPGQAIVPGDQVPPARVSLTQATASAHEQQTDPLEEDDGYYLATLTKNERITAPDWYQDVRHFEFDFEKDISYSPGDIAIIHPETPANDVEAMLTRLGWGNAADEPFVITQTMMDQSLPEHLPRISTLRILFTRYVDLNAVPRRSFFVFLRYFAKDDLEKEKLDEFLSTEGADELYEYCHRVRRTILEVLEEFRSVYVPKEYIFDVFPPLRPREFSISSSVKKYPKQVHLCVAIVRYRTKLRIPRKGTCTTYLVGLKPGDRIRVGIKPGLLQLPSDTAKHIICVGPGTGVAPMRSVIGERLALVSPTSPTDSGEANMGTQADGPPSISQTSRSSQTPSTSNNTLYFGCRSASKDQHYASEWEQLAEEGKLSYRTAFSRDGPEGKERTYVQHLIREDKERIWELVDGEGAWVYISGSSNKMPTAVKEAIAYAAEVVGGKAPEEAKMYVEEMIKNGRLFEECWS